MRKIAEGTKYKDRCGGCAFFPGNGVVCPKRPRRGQIRVKVYKLDYRCDASVLGGGR